MAINPSNIGANFYAVITSLINLPSEIVTSAGQSLKGVITPNQPNNTIPSDYILYVSDNTNYYIQISEIASIQDLS